MSLSRLISGMENRFTRMIPTNALKLKPRLAQSVVTKNVYKVI